MRLAVRWRSADPERLVERLAGVLGVDPEPLGAQDADGPGWAFELPSARLSVVGASEGRPQALALDDAEPGSAAGIRNGPGLDLVAVGWATVDTERAATDFEAQIAPLPADDLLGAAAALVVAWRGKDLAGRAQTGAVILLEPLTEGRLAGALARFGEGPAVLYFVDERPRPGASTSRAANGPFGRQILLPGYPAWGPYLVVGDRPLPLADARVPCPG